ncbi:unnamed protein product [Dicrocoelium dendriticum]|nr:unnamed protein product [Dicrocoelium dendriticum]
MPQRYMSASKPSPKLGKDKNSVKIRRTRRRQTTLKPLPEVCEKVPQTPLYIFNPEDGCRNCCPIRRRALTERLLKCMNVKETASVHSNTSLLTGWPSDMIKFTLCLPSKQVVSASNKKTRRDKRNNRDSYTGNNYKFMTTFKHLDNPDDYIVQYRLSKFPKPSNNPGLTPVTPITNLCRNAKVSIKNNPTASRFQWLKGVSKTVQSRLAAGNRDTGLTQEGLRRSNQVMTGKRKSFENLMSPDMQRMAASVADHIKGIGIILSSSFMENRRTITIQDRFKSVESENVQLNNGHTPECGDTLWIVSGTSVNK